MWLFVLKAKAALALLNGSRNSYTDDNNSTQDDESPVKSEPFEGEMSSAADEEHEVYHANKRTPPLKSLKSNCSFNYDSPILLKQIKISKIILLPIFDGLNIEV